MRILLINPCEDRSLYFRSLDERTVSFGLLSLGTYLKTKGYDVHGIDLNFPIATMQERYLRSPTNLIEEIKQFNPSICGISTFAHTRYNAYYWAKVIKDLNKKIVVVLGGVHASAEPTSILENVPQVDVVVIGEGEITMDELCVTIKRKDDLGKVKGIAFRNNGKIMITASREFIEDINSLPAIDRNLFLKSEAISKIKSLEILAGRGCPSQCKFCSSAFFWKKHRRVRSAENIINELEEGIAAFPRVKFVRFWDESLLANKDIASEIMCALKKIGLPWECWSRTCDLDEAIVIEMKSSGCWRVRIGVETGSKKLMKDLHKPVNLSNIPDLFNILRRNKLKYSPSFILGLPGSDINDIYETLNLIKQIKTDPSNCSIFMCTFLYPGTEYFKDFKEQNPDFTWENTPEKFKNQPCVLDIYGNYLFPIVHLPKEMPGWKCHLLYIKATFKGHPINSTKRFFSLFILLVRKFIRHLKWRIFSEYKAKVK